MFILMISQEKEKKPLLDSEYELRSQELSLLNTSFSEKKKK